MPQVFIKSVESLLQEARTQLREDDSVAVDNDLIYVGENLYIRRWQLVEIFENTLKDLRTFTVNNP